MLPHVKSHGPDSASLILDGKKIRKLTEEDSKHVPNLCPQLTRLSANGCLITDLSNFPILPNLEVLELQDNGLSEKSSLSPLLLLPKLKVLRLGGNRFSDPTPLVHLVSKHADLRIVDCELNPFVETVAIGESTPLGYRSLFFNANPQLMFVDGRDRSGKEIKAGDDERRVGVGDEEEEEEEEDEEEDDYEEEGYEGGGDASDKENPSEMKREDVAARGMLRSH